MRGTGPVGEWVGHRKKPGLGCWPWGGAWSWCAHWVGWAEAQGAEPLDEELAWGQGLWGTSLEGKVAAEGEGPEGEKLPLQMRSVVESP